MEPVYPPPAPGDVSRNEGNVMHSTPGAGENKRNDKGRTEPGPSQASILVRIARHRFTLFMSDDGRPYAIDRRGPNIALPLRGKGGLRTTLAKMYAEQYDNTAPSQSALTDAITVLEGFAEAADPITPQLRVARHDDAIVVDLGDTAGRCIVVGPGGWEVQPASPVVFRRSRAMRPLPPPLRTGHGSGLGALRDLLNVDEPRFRLLVAWLVGAFIPDIPHPILTFRGEQGTGKSKAAQMVIGIVDPSGAPKRTAPRNLDAWHVQAFNSWALCLDNISSIPGWLSDALCRAVTGDGIANRALYTDDDLVVLSYRRVLALTTIDAGALAGDLAERLLTIELDIIPPHRRREEREIDRVYERAHPVILGALFDLLAGVLKALPDVRLEERPRMVDFARVLAAVDQVTGWNTLADYTRGVDEAAAEVVEGDPFAKALVELVEDSGPTGLNATAEEILDLLPKPEQPVQGWPKSPRGVAGKLNRIAPALRAAGVHVERLPREERRRPWLLVAEGVSSQRKGADNRQERHDRHGNALTSGNAPDSADGPTVSNRQPPSGDRQATARLAATADGCADDPDGPLTVDEFLSSWCNAPSDLGKRDATDDADVPDGRMHLLSDHAPFEGGDQ